MHKKIEDLYKFLFEISISGSIHKLAAKAYELWQNPISIIDVQYNILSMLPQYSIEEGTWDKIRINKKVPDTMLMHFIEGRYLEESSKTDKAILVNWGIAEKTPRMVCRISTGGAIQGFISLVLQEPGAWTEKDSELLEMFARAAGLILQRSVNVAYDTYALQPAFFSALLDRTIDSQEVLQKWMMSLSFFPKEYFWMTVFSPLLSTETFMLHFEYVYKHIKKHFSGCFSACEKDRIYVLFNSDHLKDMENHIAQNKFDFYLKNRFGIGISRPYHNILLTSVFKKQADRAFQLGASQKEHLPQRIFRYEQFVSDDLAACVCENFPYENLRHPAISALKEYDSLYKTEYCFTLKCFISSFLNHSYCLEKLRIHRNTLLYRLNKIEQIADIDLSDPDTCFNLLMNFKTEEKRDSLQTVLPL